MRCFLPLTRIFWEQDKMGVYNIYYSPTGGTKKVSDIVAGAMNKDAVIIDLLKKDDFGREFAEKDICIMSAPAFGGRIPQDMAEKIKTFKGNGANAVLVAVFGNRAIDDTLAELQDLAAGAGFKVTAGIEAVAEHSLARMYGAGRPDIEDRTELEAFVGKIMEKYQNRDFSLPEIPGKRPYKQFTPSPMKPVVDNNCTDCKKCAMECPVDAIPMDNVKAVDGEKCFLCMHCAAVCPQKARNHSPEIMKAIEERLRPFCSERKPNRLYI